MIKNVLKVLSLVAVVGLFQACAKNDATPCNYGHNVNDGVLENSYNLGCNASKAASAGSNDAENAMNKSTTANFDVDKAVLKADDKNKIIAFAAYLSENASAKIVIEGHTDSRASEKYNESLAARRAIAVRDMLIAKGVKNDRIRVESYGETQPVIDNSTEENMAQNRRAVTKLIRH